MIEEVLKNVGETDQGITTDIDGLKKILFRRFMKGFQALRIICKSYGVDEPVQDLTVLRHLDL